MQNLGVGIIGAGNISSAYLKAILGRDELPGFPVLEVKALADLRPDAARQRAEEFGLTATSVEALLADPGIDMVINLTIPRAHVEVGLRALAAGKHVYSEKPLGIDLDEGRTLLSEAQRLGLRVGSAPDTFLGGGHQQARALVDAGALGTIVGGTAYFMCPGHEFWHPDPAFYYDVGGGPMLDMGPYYITDLVNLIGPVEEVGAMVSTPRHQRPILSEPRRGELIDVHVATHVAGTLRFVSGAIVQIGMSFDVAAHRHSPIELYGTEASLLVPDPNRFGGELALRRPGRDEEWQPVAVEKPFAEGNFRALGAADMASAILEDRPHRASGELALHVLEVMLAFQRASDTGTTITIESRPHRPAAL